MRTFHITLITDNNNKNEKSKTTRMDDEILVSVINGH